MLVVVHYMLVSLRIFMERYNCKLKYTAQNAQYLRGILDKEEKTRNDAKVADRILRSFYEVEARF
jgi:hypothetical protein